MLRRLRWLKVLLILSCGQPEALDLQTDTAVQALVVPPDFVDEEVTSVNAPTALAFTPDGRMLAGSQGGQLRVFANGALLSTPALDLSSVICANSERGLLGVAVDPSFATNGFIYVYYTFKKHGSCPTNNATTNPVNRVSRFTMSGNVAALSSELVLIDNIHSTAGNHNAGDLHFGRDGHLYISVGDGGCDYKDTTRCAGANAAARDMHVLIGKILRITKTGGIPADNPFQGTNSARCNVTGITTTDKRCQEIYATGLRNPFRIAFDPNASSTRFFINDVGQGRWEEIDLGASGVDYGWNAREGFCANGSTTDCGPPPAAYTNPIFAYGRGSGCASITGGAFVPNGTWPGFDQAYFYSDYVCGRIFRLSPDGAGGYTSTDFATDLGGSSAVTLRFGPYEQTQALYYTTYAGGGQVRRIRFTQANGTPTAVASASPTSGAAPLNVQFSGSGSSDPDGDTLTYAWTFGDGTTSTSAAPAHTYAAVGTYTATLVVSDGNGGVSQPSSVVITVGNTAPVATMNVVSLFSVGETITLNGSATDAQDGTLAASSLSWRVLLHHDAHTHPFLPATSGNDITFTAPAPEDLAAAATSRLEVILTATDAGGLTHTVSQFIEPRKVQITFATSPTGRTVNVNGTTLVGPSTVTSWQGYVLNVDVPQQAGFTFSSWSDGGAQAHAITTPATATTYTAALTATAVSIKVNFQQPSSATPAGYLPDTGLAFGARGNGYSYGWNMDNTAQSRDRNASNSADQRYDTLNHLQKPENPNASWQIALPNGTYTVTVVSGDPSHWDSTFRIAAEGTTILSGTPTSSRRWLSATAKVTVSDGRLTLSNGAGAANNKINFVEISQP